jgi:hypothetical protein
MHRLDREGRPRQAAAVRGTRTVATTRHHSSHCVTADDTAQPVATLLQHSATRRRTVAYSAFRRLIRSDRRAESVCTGMRCSRPRSAKARSRRSPSMLTGYHPRFCPTACSVSAVPLAYAVSTSTRYIAVARATGFAAA